MIGSFRSWTLGTLAALLLLLGSSGHAQTSASNTKFGTVTAVGSLSNAVSFAGLTTPPTHHTIAWSNDGTAAAVCTVTVLGSLDGKHWYNLIGSVNCAGNGSLILPTGSLGDMFHIIDRPLWYLQVYVTAYTAGDSTTAVTFRYVNGA